MHHFQSDTKLAIVLHHGQIIIIVITTRIVKGWFDQGPSQIIVTNENGFPKELLETPVYLKGQQEKRIREWLLDLIFQKSANLIKGIPKT